MHTIDDIEPPQMNPNSAVPRDSSLNSRHNFPVYPSFLKPWFEGYPEKNGYDNLPVSAVF
jgi:hypothetical protein